MWVVFGVNAAVSMLFLITLALIVAAGLVKGHCDRRMHAPVDDGSGGDFQDPSDGK